MTARYGIKENQVRAFNKMIRVSHQKLNLVCDLVRNLPVERAGAFQEFRPRPSRGQSGRSARKRRSEFKRSDLTWLFFRQSI